MTARCLQEDVLTAAPKLHKGGGHVGAFTLKVTTTDTLTDAEQRLLTPHNTLRQLLHIIQLRSDCV